MVKEKTNIVDFFKISQEEYLKVYSEMNDCFDKGFKLVTKIEKKEGEEETLVKKYLKEPITKYNEEDAIYYAIVLEKNNFKFVSYIEIGLDYPAR